MNAKPLLVGALVCAGVLSCLSAEARAASPDPSPGLAGAAEALSAQPAAADLGTPVGALQNSSSSNAGSLHVTGEISGPAPAGAGGGLGAVLGAVVDPGALAGTTTGTPSIVSWTEQRLTATSTDNTVSAGGDVSSGGVSLGSNAFTGFAGIGNIVINTGHLNVLQGSLSVNLVMAPPSGGQ
jgi:hypothetical protein